MAPGMSLPRAALAEAWDTQALAGITKARGEELSIVSLQKLIEPAQYQLVAEATLAACDKLDGTEDGIIGAVGQCTTERVLPELRKRAIAPEQIDALVKIMDGARDSSGKQLYARWAWDSGIASPGWAVWKTGLEQGPPALNVVLGAGSLAAVFTTPPTALSTDPEALLAWQLAFDFDRDAAKIYAVAPPYSTSAWQDVGMRSTDLATYRAHGGKLLVPHGVSDPVFSVLDTIDWWKEVDQRQGGTASDFVQVYPVPGMNHCGGGHATDRFDSLGALERWVEEGEAPEAIAATAGPDAPWPGRAMPLCPYPKLAVKQADGQYACQTKP
jgi:feruloyl esterase